MKHVKYKSSLVQQHLIFLQNGRANSNQYLQQFVCYRFNIVFFIPGFVLKKENLETLDAISKLSNALRVQPSQFSYAGIKDKKAVTTQAMCVKGVTKDRLVQCILSMHAIKQVDTHDSTLIL